MVEVITLTVRVILHNSSYTGTGAGVAQGNGHQGQEPVTLVYEWFTEGFDTKDLKRAKVLLRELGWQVKKKPADAAGEIHGRIGRVSWRPA